MSSAAAQHQDPDTEQTPQQATDETSKESLSDAPVEDPAEDSGVDHARMPSLDLLRRQMAHCGEYTFQALNKIGKLSPEDTSRITQRYLKKINSMEKGESFDDALSFLVLEGWQKDEVEASGVTQGLTRALIRYSKTKVTNLAFANQTDTPIEFYTENPGISEIARLMGCPIIQVSETDFLSVTTINPFTGAAAVSLISNEIEQLSGRKPFTFVTTTDLNGWRYSCERHFGT
jgi:hypothetical protein